MTFHPSGTPPPRVALAVTGASGAIYAERILVKIIEAGIEPWIVFSAWASRVVEWEIPHGPLASLLVASAHASEAELGGQRVRFFSNENMMAPLASGSDGPRAMVVAPCSMGTLGRISQGVSGTLIERAADVMLKERRPLVLVTRECPLSLIHLRNMCALTEAGGIIVPASPGFYHRPQNIVELVDFVAERALAQIGLSFDKSISWEGEP